MCFSAGRSLLALNSMIQITQSPLEAQQMLEIQNWLQQGQCAKLKKQIRGLIAFHQEAASRLLIESISDPRKEADAKEEADKASQLLNFLTILTTIAAGKMELPITKISIEQ